MPLPHNALVLVADGRKMLFFRNHGDENQIDLRTEAHDARDYQRKDREIKPDAPGTVKQSFGFGRSTYEEADFQQQEEDRRDHGELDRGGAGLTVLAPAHDPNRIPQHPWPPLTVSVPRISPRSRV